MTDETLAEETVGDPLASTPEAETMAAGGIVASGRVKPWEAFRIRSFRYLWFNSFSFSMIQSTERFAFVWLMLELYDQAEQAGRIALVLGAPAFFGVSMVGGWAADQFDRRSVMLVTQGMAATVTAVLAVLLFFDQLTYTLTFVLAFLVGITLAVGSPVRMSTIPTVVPEHTLMNAIVLNGFAQNISQIIGPALGGFIISAWGVKGSFIFVTVLYLVGMVAILPLRIPPHDLQLGRGDPAAGLRGVFAKLWSDLRAGLAFVGGHAGIRALFVFLGVAALFLMGPYAVLVPQIARVKLDRDVVEASFLFTVLGAGQLVSTLIQASLGNIPHKGRTFLIACSGCGLSLAAAGLSTSYALTMVIMFFWGVIAGFFVNLLQTLIQSNTPRPYLGRVASVQTWVMQGLTPVGALAAGWGADGFGVTTWLLLSGAALAAAAIVISMAQPALRDM
jgi:MFS family permease